MTSGPRLTIAAKNGTPVSPAGEPVPPPREKPTLWSHGLDALLQAADWFAPFAAAVWLRKWTALAALIALLLALYFGPTAIFGPKVVGDVAVRGLFLQTVVASGHVEAPFRVNAH